MKDFSAVIIASGRGSRLKQECKDIPKALLTFNETPFLLSLVEWLFRARVNEIFVTTHTHSDLIEEFIEKSFAYNRISVVKEKVLRNPVVSMLNGLLRVNTKYALILVADTLWDVNLTELCNYHKRRNATITILATTQKKYLSGKTFIHASDSGQLLQVKNSRDHCCTRCLLSKGLYVVNVKRFLQLINCGHDQLIVRDLATMNKSHSWCMVNNGFCLDFGIPDKLRFLRKNPLLVQKYFS